MIKAIQRAGFVVAFLTAACSSTETTSSSSGGTSSGGTSGTTGSSGGSSGSSGTSSGTSGTSAGPAAPTLNAVVKMNGVLHVRWTLPSTKCDAIEGERKATMMNGAEMEKYKVLFSVAGDVDNKMDTAATDDMKYTYRLRCKVGSAYSPYSSEVGENPKG